ncbi:hypothetical protein TSUD_141390 [Trifolium subterraneum]|uniref:Auxin-induced protein n=1 Tax=Trifolium subterraneum TaxID=3900 RepID=A0A2Z6PPW0_TRISU|nr:hypothetical protein TSUD_141390 [Trifolium subterraneum]
MESSEKFSQRSSNNGLNLKATKLRLGLPGSESPERDDDDVFEDKNVYPLCMLKSLVSGAKRGFSDAIDVGSSKWILSGNGGSEIGMSKDCINKQGSVLKEKVEKSSNHLNEKKSQITSSAAKEQVVGWPPIRSFRKNSMASQSQKNDDEDDEDVEAKSGCLYVKVSMDGAPYLRKVDLKFFSTYMELSSALEKMFSCFTIKNHSKMRLIMPQSMIYFISEVCPVFEFDTF